MQPQARRKRITVSGRRPRNRTWRNSSPSRRTEKACRPAAAPPPKAPRYSPTTAPACHGQNLQGISTPGIGGDRLIGGRGTLASNAPVKTVESYWPYATTLFDYVKRAMPFNSPGSLSDDDVYNVVAYILSRANIIKPTEVIDAKSLPKVVMPNRNGFEPDPRPELELYR
jgi:cytochrome c